VRLTARSLHHSSKKIRGTWFKDGPGSQAGELAVEVSEGWTRITTSGALRTTALAWAYLAKRQRSRPISVGQRSSPSGRRAPTTGDDDELTRAQILSFSFPYARSGRFEEAARLLERPSPSIAMRKLAI